MYYFCALVDGFRSLNDATNERVTSGQSFFAFGRQGSEARNGGKVTALSMSKPRGRRAFLPKDAQSVALGWRQTSQEGRPPDFRVHLRAKWSETALKRTWN
jgi:hypothetical protein